MRNPETTRQKILEISAEEIHQHGYTGASLSVILARSEISKGALYHHFANKQALGYAVLEEVFTPMFIESWQQALQHDDPIAGMCHLLAEMAESADSDGLSCGCPMNNLSQEMAAIDEGFRLRVFAMYQQLNQLIVAALARIKTQLKPDLELEQVAYFIIASIQGAASLAKSSRCCQLFSNLLNELQSYLRGLRV
ncbi:TetR/AcrR family transcriptional regulator [Thalassomonas sp. RHCl1]|uniref:TetR/AcrR family transcriptional regulator n=1 Tax=Thalassomonas sp. RHCl1 TaxID=2995320 RepID=UPI00248BEE45|nr:TetR/AcrR family transcriptional regulator [Thalassomonas sp. RHCl1]